MTEGGCSNTFSQEIAEAFADSFLRWAPALFFLFLFQDEDDAFLFFFLLFLAFLFTGKVLPALLSLQEGEMG